MPNVSPLDAARQRLTDALALWQALQTATAADASFVHAESVARQDAVDAARAYVEAARRLLSFDP